MAPDFDLNYAGEVTVGNYGMRQARGTETRPLSDNMAVSLDGKVHQNDGYIEVADGREANYRDRMSDRGQLLFNPSANTEVPSNAV